MEAMSEQERFEQGVLPRELDGPIGNIVLRYAEQLALFYPWELETVGQEGSGNPDQA